MPKHELQCVIPIETPLDQPMNPECCDHVCSNCLQNKENLTDGLWQIKTEKCTLFNEIRLHGKFSLNCNACGNGFLKKEPIKFVHAPYIIIILAAVANFVLIFTFILFHGLGYLELLFGTFAAVMLCLAIDLVCRNSPLNHFYRIVRKKRVVFLCYVWFISTAVYILRLSSFV